METGPHCTIYFGVTCSWLLACWVSGEQSLPSGWLELFFFCFFLNMPVMYWKICFTLGITVVTHKCLMDLLFLTNWMSPFSFKGFLVYFLCPQLLKSWWDILLLACVSVSLSVTLLYASCNFCYKRHRRMWDLIVSVSDHCLSFYFEPCILWTMHARIYEPCHEIMVLFALCKLILQTCMHSHTVGLDVWFLVVPFVYNHSSCVWTAKAVARLCGCPGSPEP